MSLFFNLLVLCCYLVFFLIIDASIRSFFGKRTKIESQNARFNELKSIRVKTIDEQKEFLRLQGKLGFNYPAIILVNIGFLLAYMTLIYDRVPSFIVGMVSAVIFAPLMAYGAVQIVGKEYKDMFFLSFMNSFIFMFIFLNYVRFFYIYNIFLVIGLMIVITLGFGKVWRWVKW